MNRELRAIVLAGGDRCLEGGAGPIFLELLGDGDRRVIDWVVAHALSMLSPEDVTVVVSRGPWKGLSHVEQEEPLGTGHAVLKTRSRLAGFDGDVLILYGDTPLLRLDSLRGLVNWHRLTGADFTLMTCTAPGEAFPYGRVVRDGQGQVAEVVEDEDASQDERRVEELNGGTCVARADCLYSVLEELTPSPLNGHYRLTDGVNRLIAAGHKVEAFRIHDPDEIVGINTRADLERAAFILQRRVFRPQRVEDADVIRFGTGGWRAVIGEGFTLPNVRRLCQVLANEAIRCETCGRGVVVGYDRRFLSARAAEAASEVFAANNVPVTLMPEPVPTPLVTHATAEKGSAYGLVFTASHNPPEWNGLKVFYGDGALLQTEETNRIEAEAAVLTTRDVVRLDLDLAVKAGMVRYECFHSSYLDAVESVLDLKTIRDAGLRVMVDPMYGVGQVTLESLLTEARCRVTTIHGRHDALFGGRSPAPSITALGLLMTTVREGDYDLGLATDGDADRIALVDERGEYVSVNDLLLLLYHFLIETRGERGGVVRNLATTHLLDRLAAHHGETCYETPVGFKHIVAGMQEHDALLGGESSGGLTVRGHILGKDGILAAGLLVEMLALTGKRVGTLLEEVYELTGRLYAVEESLPATSEMRLTISGKLGDSSLDVPGDLESLSRIDGFKFRFGDDAWLLIRFSGTEPVLRIFAESESQQRTGELVAWAKGVVVA